MHRTAREQIDRAPDSPGVYLFKGAEGRVLYVGKAKRLCDRLRAYLAPGRDERPSVSLLIPRIESVEWILTETEKEALLLENSLIKTHLPRYNIMLRDDKSYVSLRLTAHRFPRLFITRKIVRDGSEYFGPYGSVADLRQTLKLLQKLFQVRDCSDSFFAHRSRPCLRYQIKRCSAPCVDYVTSEAYAAQVEETRLFLNGERALLAERLRQDMKRASVDLRYEDAARVRDRIRAVEETLEPQEVESRTDERDADAIGLAGDGEATLVKILKVRRGRMISADEFFLNEPLAAASEITRAFLQHYYLSEDRPVDAPRQLLVATEIGDRATFEALISERGGRKVKIRRPMRGTAARLLHLAERNAASSLGERKRRSERNQKVLEELQRKLHLRKFPRKIEGYDISSFHGAEPVGSMVVFVEGESDSSGYRHYRIRSVKGSNDFGMLREMFERRFRKLTPENAPDLVLVDGGKGQLRQIVEVLRELQIEGMDVVSIAKEKEVRSRSGRRFAPERLFLPGQKNAIIFPASSPILHLLQRVRDEAHRFGITRHRRSRRKATLTSLLSRVPGIGPKRIRRLLTSFGSVERVRGASLEQLRQVQGMTQPSAAAIFNFLRKPADLPDSE